VRPAGFAPEGSAAHAGPAGSAPAGSEAPAGLAGTPDSAPPSVPTNELAARVDALEAEVASLREDLERLRSAMG